MNLSLSSKLILLPKKVGSIAPLFFRFQALVLFLVVGCAVGPHYVKPQANVPNAFKEDQSQKMDLTHWKKLSPRDQIAKGDWWTVFKDADLDALEKEAEFNNQNLQASIFRVTESRSMARATQSQFFPSLSFDPSATRTRISPNGVISIFTPSGTTTTTSTSTATQPPLGEIPPGTPATTFNDFKVPFDLSYELDIWGRIRRLFEGAKAQAQASLADYENVLLTLKADVALNYFNLRSIDAQRQLLRETVELRKKALNLTKLRSDAGLANEVDVTQAETEFHAAKAQYLTLGQNRAQVEHALAILIGRAPTNFALPEKAVKLEPPLIPPGLPAEVLERRPDIAEAERNVAAASAQIGVATAAFFPIVTLTGQAGYESVDASTLFNWNSRTWSFGPSINLPVFEGGKNLANLRQARAAYNSQIANYRQKVLTAFGEVEDSLSNLHYLKNELVEQNLAAKAAHQSSDLSHQQYEAGAVNYLQVIEADRARLNNEVTAVQLQGQRLVSTVQLIKAIGGGWQDSRLLPVLKADQQPVLPPEINTVQNKN